MSNRPVPPCLSTPCLRLSAKGYIDKSYLDVALKGYKGFLDNFIEVDRNGLVTITKACAVAGLGGKVYRSGDYDYYINETIRNNDPKVVGPFIMASLNMNVYKSNLCR